jgi:hypothetical protein
MAVVSIKPEDREVSKEWFRVVGGAHCRSVSTTLSFLPRSPPPRRRPNSYFSLTEPLPAGLLCVCVAGWHTNCRGLEDMLICRESQSVPPVWIAVEKLWRWLDASRVEEPYDEEQPVIQRRAWWEEMVAKLVEESGVLSLV